MAEIETFIAGKRAEGYGIDVRMMLLLAPRFLAASRP
jgi:hypothetical protein